MSKTLTVLQVIPRMRAGGAELGCLQIATALVKNGHRALVASEGGQLVDQVVAAGAEHINMPLASKNPLVLAKECAATRRHHPARKRLDHSCAKSRARVERPLCCTKHAHSFCHDVSLRIFRKRPTEELLQ